MTPCPIFIWYITREGREGMDGLAKENVVWKVEFVLFVLIEDAGV